VQSDGFTFICVVYVAGSRFHIAQIMQVSLENTFDSTPFSLAVYYELHLLDHNEHTFTNEEVHSCQAVFKYHTYQHL